MKKTEKLISFQTPQKGVLAPELVKVLFAGKVIKFGPITQGEIGYYYITNKKRAIELVKRFLRQKSNLSSKVKAKRQMVFIDSERTPYNITGYQGYVNPYDIKEKLALWKEFKTAIPAMNIKTVTLKGGYKVESIVDEIRERPKIIGICFKD